jgi:hypothetical protein
MAKKQAWEEPAQPVKLKDLIPNVRESFGDVKLPTPPREK